ncbi:hypothetical protein [uncultured Weissella sp.]|uniref:hypothetical protein n=1 Tax=uncultured Weissella sp. TaxID=253243 RepID=UPI0025932398|nr:hypothetical protein [uncultured Weissella sp.]
MFDLGADVSESKLKETFPQLLEILLIDRTTSQPSRMKNIIWANDNYAYMDPKKYGAEVQMTVSAVTNGVGNLIQPRALKSNELQDCVSLHNILS